MQRLIQFQVSQKKDHFTLAILKVEIADKTIAILIVEIADKTRLWVVFMKHRFLLNL
jgi:hypothetical protein